MDESRISQVRVSLIREKMLSIVGMVLTVTSLLLGGMMLFYGFNLDYVRTFSGFILVPFVTGVIMVLAGELFANRKVLNTSGSNNRLEKELQEFSKEFTSFREHIIENLKKTDDTINNITTNNISSIDLTNDEKDQLFERLSKDVRQLVTKSIIEEVGAQQKNKIQHEDVLSFTTSFRERLMRESERLFNRANTNLFIGSITSIIGITFLGYILIGNKNVIKLSEMGLTVQLAEYALYYLPRLTLIIFIEVFSYFFLRLYKSTLDDIKYYQNELTNVDSNISALRLSLLLNDAESIKKVSSRLLETERNFILKKGDSTVQLEVARTEAKKSAEALKMFENIFKETKNLLPRLGSNK